MSWGLLKGMGQGLAQTGQDVTRFSLEQAREEWRLKQQERIAQENRSYQREMAMEDRQYNEGREDAALAREDAKSAFETKIEDIDGVKMKVVYNKDKEVVSRTQVEQEPSEYGATSWGTYSKSTGQPAYEVGSEASPGMKHTDALNIVKELGEKARNDELTPNETRLYEGAIRVLQSGVGNEQAQNVPSWAQGIKLPGSEAAQPQQPQQPSTQVPLRPSAQGSQPPAATPEPNPSKELGARYRQAARANDYAEIDRIKAESQQDGVSLPAGSRIAGALSTAFGTPAREVGGLLSQAHSAVNESGLYQKYRVDKAKGIPLDRMPQDQLIVALRAVKDPNEQKQIEAALTRLAGAATR